MADKDMMSTECAQSSMIKMKEKEMSLDMSSSHSTKNEKKDSDKPDDHK